MGEVPGGCAGHIKITSAGYRFAALEADYNSMQDMLYGDVPTFETVIAAVRELEKRSIHYNNYISVYLPAILRCFRIAGFLFSKEGCYITQNEVNAVFDEQVRLCADTLKRKTKEYTGDAPDRLGAFKAAAALQHTTPQRALAGMLAKHIVSLYDMCFSKETVYPIDTWDEKITDSLNYLFLLKAIVKEGHTN